MTNIPSGMTPAAIEEMINRRVIEALETREANRNIRLGKGNDKGGNGKAVESDREEQRFGCLCSNIPRAYHVVHKWDLDEWRKSSDEDLWRSSDNIQGDVVTAERTRLRDAVRMANNLMDQKLKGYAMKSAENKRSSFKHQKETGGQQTKQRHNV
ncbi:hypothetical protein Tco_1106129 [Tanacetum coccineum]